MSFPSQSENPSGEENTARLRTSRNAPVKSRWRIIRIADIATYGWHMLRIYESLRPNYYAFFSARQFPLINNRHVKIFDSSVGRCAFVLRTESWQFYSTVDVPNDPCASKKSVVHVYILRGSCSEVWKRLATRRQASIRSRFNVGIYSSLSFSLSFFSVRDASVPWLQFFPPFDFCLNRDATSKVAFRILYRDAARKNGKRRRERTLFGCRSDSRRHTGGGEAERHVYPGEKSATGEREGRDVGPRSELIFSFTRRTCDAVVERCAYTRV